jgi:hypothetical protein
MGYWIPYRAGQEIVCFGEVEVMLHSSQESTILSEPDVSPVYLTSYLSKTYFNIISHLLCLLCEYLFEIVYESHFPHCASSFTYIISFNLTSLAILGET